MQTALASRRVVAIRTPIVSSPCTLAGTFLFTRHCRRCRPGGTVLDPFSGAATTALAARQLGRQFIGIELNADCCKLAVARIREASATAGGIG
ncbi:DNA methyltransferase [Microbispora maris]|uniref:DNA methyltransferase n=1 Tax=Microbispora maris TaxID=3144104 RepID=UPI003D158F9B